MRRNHLAVLLAVAACEPGTAQLPSAPDASVEPPGSDAGQPDAGEPDAGQPPQTVTFDVVACAVAAVNDHCDQPVPGATARVHLSTHPDTFAEQALDSDGYGVFTVDASLVESDLLLDAPGYQPLHVPIEPPQMTAQHNIFTLTRAHVDPATVPEAALRAFRGDFGGLYLPELAPQCPEDPVTHIQCTGDNGATPHGLVAGELFTPAYGNYTPDQRRAIRQAYKARGYTHFPYSLTGLTCATDWYHSLYPPAPCGGARDDELLQELWDDGLYPVVFVLPDGALSTDLSGLDRSLVRIVVPMWEMNGPLADDTTAINAAIQFTRDQFPAALLYVHFTAEHAAGGSPEADWWVMAKSQWNVAGILYQDDRWNDPAAVKDRVTDFLVRMGGGYHGWPTGLDFVLFETDIYTKFWDGRTEQEGIDFNDQVLTLMTTPACISESGVDYCGTIKGFCSGGTVH